MSGRGILLEGVFIAVIAMLVLVFTDLGTAAAIGLVAAFGAYAAFLLVGVHRARSRH